MGKKRRKKNEKYREVALRDRKRREMKQKIKRKGGDINHKKKEGERDLPAYF